MSDIRDLMQGRLLPEIETIHAIFARHITVECETCRGEWNMQEDAMRMKYRQWIHLRVVRFDRVVVPVQRGCEDLSTVLCCVSSVLFCACEQSLSEMSSTIDAATARRVHRIHT
jgi:hypothetical protein